MREFIVISQNYCKLHGKFSDESSETERVRLP